jgi:inner membrane protein
MSRSIFMKAVVTGGLAILLIVPLNAIHGIVLERVALRDGVIANIQRSSVTAQKVVGPLLVIPFRRTIVEITTDAKGQLTSTTRGEDGQLQFLPDELEIITSADTERRYRGIYSALLYNTKNTFRGSFSLPEELVSDTDVPGVSYSWGRAHVALGMTDTRGIKGRLTLKWTDGARSSQVDFRGGTLAAPIGAGVHAPVETVLPKGVYRFSLDLQLQGAQELEFVAAGKETTIHMRSSWPHPSFIGQFLPESRNISAGGFDAVWRTSRLASNVEEALAHCGANPCGPLLSKSMGVSFVQPVNVYLQTERSAKYGFLFIVFTFVLFSLFELLKRLSIHPVQYALVGVALAMFFLLLIALSEHLPFVAAYVVASASCVLLLGFYVSYVLAGVRRGAGFAALLAALYGALYVLLQSEDMALLLGAILLFGIVAGIMAVTRKVDWYRITARASEA